ncbi:MAG: hypothetical protein MJE77_15020 [Proteobacteria bacterium]|nr:hypothetical protein [Pseudomonadota bacterium]
MQRHEAYLRDFYQALADQPLEPDDPRYIAFYNDAALTSADPIASLARTIEWSPLESKQLFSGFRGTGKSTELRRLRKMLSAGDNTRVVLCNMEEYLNLTTPVDISDFLVSVAGAFSDELQRDRDLLGEDMQHEGYWTRFASFLTRTRIELPSLSGSDKSTSIKVSLKADPTFRQLVQDKLRGHLGTLAADVRSFMEQCFKAMCARHGGDVRVVLLLDSVERIRGTSLNAESVAASVENLFQGHADKLGFPYLHVVYTVPPWLKIKAPGVAALYDNSQQIPCVKARDSDGARCPAGLNALERLIAQRGDWQRLLGERTALDRLCLVSGGYLRDLFRLLQALLRLSSDRPLPADNERIDLVEHEIRNSYLPIPNQHAIWLARIQTTQATELEDATRLHQLARYFDNHLVLAYRNGKEWWSVHPLISDYVARQAERNRERRPREP